ncbi:unnamed protein product [Brassica napus]|uniref:(rape) hypothetical protein n=1 Tax=Brassica napus TaxID=3708 RepID=A0A816MCI5_BRANA|nr:unnamed protein product [Brassica napus]
MVVAKIEAIDLDKPWYYTACNFCKRKMVRQGDGFEGNVQHLQHNPIYNCKTCNKDFEHAIHCGFFSYYLVVHVSDDSKGEAKFLLFNNIAEMLIRRPAFELVQEAAQENPHFLPQSLTDLIGRKLLFKITIRTYGTNDKENTPMGSITQNSSITNVSPLPTTQSPFQQTKTNEFIPPARFIVEDHPEAYNDRYEMESESENENEDEENQTYTTYPAGESFINPSPQHIPQQTNNTVTSPIIIGIQKNGYYDDGDLGWNCTFCQAYMWYGERIGKRRRSSNPVFTMCCKGGKVVLPRLANPPMELMTLLCKGDELSKHYREFIRAYNMMFSFTSLGGRGGKIDHSINNGRGPFVFRLSGENYHRIGDIVPEPGQAPKFSQLYVIDTLNEIKNRLDAYAGSDRAAAKKLREPLVLLLKNMLDQCNPHVKDFRSARDRFDVEESTGYRMRLIESRQSDGRTHNLPTANVEAALIPGDFVLNMETRDIVLESTSGKLQGISELHPAYLPLQYPLLFPYGEDGFRLNIPIGFEESTVRKRKNVTMREYFAFRILERRWEAPTITRSGMIVSSVPCGRLHNDRIE